jgi:sugar O-acyltransferase (sialic acid O-acetyltransferase NeuD family)
MPSETTLAFGLYGAGGFAREVMPFARLSAAAEGDTHIYFVETIPGAWRVVNSMPIIKDSEFFQLTAERKLFNIAIADSKARAAIAEDCMARGAVPLMLRAENTAIYDGNDIGEGAILCANTTITSNVRIGRFFHANIYSYVGHDCVIGDFVTFAPRVSCNGNVHIGDHAYIGTGAIIRNGTADKPLVIGEGAVVGMGAVVTKDVPPFATVVGNPAREMGSD